MEIKNKNILITGGSKGLGKILALKLIEFGGNVIIFDNDSKANIQFRNDKVQNIEIYDCDISDYTNLNMVLEQTLHKYKNIDVLVNNAAWIENSLLINIFGAKIHSIDLWNKTIDTNLNGTFYTTALVVQNMIINRKKGLIINVSSVVAGGNKGQSAYAATKAAIESLTKTWAHELGINGIRVACLAPGYTESDSVYSSVNKMVIKNVKDKTPLLRMAYPEEIIDGFIFIIKNNFFNGKVLNIDGGLII